MKSAGEMYYWIDCKVWGLGEASVRRAGVGHVKRGVFRDFFGRLQRCEYLDLRHLRPSGWFVCRVMGMKKLQSKGRG